MSHSSMELMELMHMAGGALSSKGSSEQSLTLIAKFKKYMRNMA